MYVTNFRQTLVDTQQSREKSLVRIQRNSYIGNYP